MQQYLKLQVQHITCLHEKTGFVSLLSNNMFLKNSTFFTQIGRDFNVPTDCIKLTKNNNEKCGQFFGKGPIYILHCRHNSVYGTGNISYLDPLLQIYKLSFVPTLIPDLHFPIQLNNQQLYKNNICADSKNIAIPHLP